MASARKLTIFPRFCGKLRYVYSQADFIAPTSDRVTHYFKTERAKLPLSEEMPLR
jgi:hypothetical protein